LQSKLTCQKLYTYPSPSVSKRKREAVSVLDLEQYCPIQPYCACSTIRFDASLHGLRQTILMFLSLYDVKVAIPKELATGPELTFQTVI
jgi:hypothetical protein